MAGSTIHGDDNSRKIPGVGWEGDFGLSSCDMSKRCPACGRYSNLMLRRRELFVGGRDEESLADVRRN